MIDVEDFLQHYGILGMKWGVIRSNSSGTIDVADKKGEKDSVRATRPSILKKKSKAIDKEPKTPPTPKPVVVTSTRGKQTQVQTRGGALHPPSQDAINVAAARQRARASGPVTLSNAELKAVITRMDLEQKYLKLDPAYQSLGKRWLKKYILPFAKEKATKYAKENANRLTSDMIKKASQQASSAATQLKLS